VNLPAYFIGKTDVTNAQFRHFIMASGYSPSTKYGSWESFARKWGESAPVVEVSWYDANAYSRWAGLRLPTEAEWEKAARGTDGRIYPWGNDWDPSLCNNSVVTKSDGARNAGCYPSGASPYGCLDLAGNVWQWCSTSYKPYPYNSADGREQTTGTEPRVVRGGSWLNTEKAAFRTSDRSHCTPDFTDSALGFRLATDAETH
jgi:formylglycine-generating enzyme required for sulfatase activity